MSIRRHPARAAAALVVGVVLAAAALFAAPAHAAGNAVTLRRVDSTDPSKVQVVFQYDGSAGDVNGAKVTENGKTINAGKITSAADAKADPGVMFVVDSSASTDKSAVLAESRKAIEAMVDALPGNLQIGVVTAGGNAALLQRLTTDKAAVKKALSVITPNGDGALWEGVGRAAGQFEDNPSVVPMIVLVTDGVTGKGTSFEQAKGDVSSVGAEVFAVGVSSDTLNGDPQALANDSGGTYLTTNRASDLTSLLPKLQPAITGQYAFTYKSATPSGVNDLTIQVGNASVRGSYVAGSVARGAHSLAYDKPVSSSGITFFQNGLGKLLAVLLALAAAAGAAFVVITMLVREDTELTAALRPYSEYTVGGQAGDDEEEGDDRAMAQTPLVQRAVQLTGQLAERQGLLVKAEGALERANLPLRAAEAIFFYFAGAVVVTLLVLGMSRNIIVALIVAVLLVMAAPATLNFLASQRKRKFEQQLPDMLQLLSGTLRAGYSMMQGVEAVSQEVEDPMGRELRRVVTETRLGRPLEESLDSVAERMGSNDFAWATMAIRIQREVGGNLAELLMTVAETMTHRERLRRDVKTLTAEGRMSAYVLGILPIGLGLAMYVLNPDYMSQLWESGTGEALLIGGGALMIAGFYWMSRIVKIEL